MIHSINRTGVFDMVESIIHRTELHVTITKRIHNLSMAAPPCPCITVRGDKPGNGIAQDGNAGYLTQGCRGGPGKEMHCLM